LEEDIRHLEMLRLKRGAVEEWRVNTNATGASISNAERPVKRTRGDATGRTEALGLNGLEQIVVAEARLKPRQNKKEIQKKIRQARNEAKLVNMSSASLWKDRKKATMDVGKLQKSCETFAAKNSVCSVKISATTTSAHAQKASEKAQVIFEGMAAKLPCISEAMRMALEWKAKLSQAENALKKLEDNASNVQNQAAEEEEEKDDVNVAHVHVTDEVVSKYEVAMADLDEARNASNSADAYANKAALNALLAATREAWIRAVALPERGRDGGSCGGDRGRNMLISATSVTTTSLSPVVVAPFNAQ
jgi:predicted  nucleic acid-binding Zn-ribbon protein